MINNDMYDYSKYTDDQLTKKLMLVNSRLSYYYGSDGNIVNQLNMMQTLIQQEFDARIQEQIMKSKINNEPEVRDFAISQNPAPTADKKSRAKKKSDIIGRMRRTMKPTSIKDS